MAGIHSQAKGALLGVAVGDALGATLEFMSKEDIRRQYGVLKDIIGGGFWGLNPGEITDDTDMTIAVAKGILTDPENPIEQIAQFFVEWLKTEPKDIGKICRIALTEGMKRNCQREDQWLQAAAAAHELSGKRSGGNGSLMRTIPVVLAYLHDGEKMRQIARRQSALTHFEPVAGKSVSLYCDLVRSILLGAGLKPAIRNTVRDNDLRIVYDLPYEQIKTSGYVVDTLEAALNCAYQTDSLEDALIMAVNLGGDADTIGAVTGGIVGGYYGLEKIPGRWLNKLVVRDEMQDLADRLIELSAKIIYTKRISVSE